MKYEEYFHFKSTKHWRFDLHLIEHRMLIEIATGPWSGGRKGKLATKAWNMDRYDHAEELGYRFHRFELADINMERAKAWLKALKKMNYYKLDISKLIVSGCLITLTFS